MPYARKTFRRRYRRRRKRAIPWYSKKYSVASLATKAMRGVWKLKGLVNSEKYKLDTQFVNNITTAGGVVSLVNIPIGDSDSTRTANSVFVRSLNMKGLLYRPTTGDTVQHVRISVIMDTQQISDQAPFVTDIYENTNPWAHLNSETVGRYKVLWTRSYVLDNVNKLAFNVMFNLPMRHHVRYNGSNGTDVQKGGLYLVYSSTQNTTNFPTLSAEVRTSYHDN